MIVGIYERNPIVYAIFRKAGYAPRREILAEAAAPV
jgi:hypothetical protein